MDYYSPTMPFGKYKGTPINEIPTSYLLWIMNTIKRGRYNLKCHIGSVLNDRGVMMPGGTMKLYNFGTGEYELKEYPPSPWMT